MPKIEGDLKLVPSSQAHKLNTLVLHCQRTGKELLKVDGNGQRVYRQGKAPRNAQEIVQGFFDWSADSDCPALDETVFLQRLKRLIEKVCDDGLRAVPVRALTHLIEEYDLGYTDQKMD